MALIVDDELVVAQVGDCRTYRLSHAVATHVFPIGPRLMEAANVLGTVAVARNVVRIRMIGHERLVMCSDGLHVAIDEATIAEHAASGGVDDAVRKLMEQAKATSRDNIALAILEIGGEPSASWKNAPPYEHV